MRLHLTSVPIAGKLIDTRQQDRCYFKPRGLWWGVDMAWLEWMETGWPDRYEMDLTGPTWLFEVVLPAQTKLLSLQSPNDLDAFTHKYGCGDPDQIFCEIDWPSVAQQYDGIEIDPYQWCRRLELGWYYSWDCASGCIWNTDGVQLVDRTDLLTERRNRLKRLEEVPS